MRHAEAYTVLFDGFVRRLCATASRDDSLPLLALHRRRWRSGASDLLVHAARHGAARGRLRAFAGGLLGRAEGAGAVGPPAELDADAALNLGPRRGHEEEERGDGEDGCDAVQGGSSHSAIAAAAALADCRDPVQLAQRPATPLAADVAASEASYEIIDLGTLGGNLGQALAINARGQVVGWSETASRIRHAFLWEDGVMQDLGTLAGGFSSASAINNRGDIAGFSTDAAGSARTVLWTGGVLQDLGAGGGPVLSETGLVAWTAWTPTGAHPQLWDHGQVVDLGTLGGAYASATGINSRGQVDGWSDVPTASGAPHPFLWENGVMRDLGTFGGVFAVAAGINDRGQVTGSSTDANVNSHAFLWDGEMLALGTLGADRVSTGQLINERGEVAWLSIRCNSC